MKNLLGKFQDYQISSAQAEKISGEIRMCEGNDTNTCDFMFELDGEYFFICGDSGYDYCMALLA